MSGRMMGAWLKRQQPIKELSMCLSVCLSSEIKNKNRYGLWFSHPLYFISFTLWCSLTQKGSPREFLHRMSFLTQTQRICVSSGITSWSCRLSGKCINHHTILHCENINSQADNFFISFRYTTIEASTIVYSV